MRYTPKQLAADVAALNTELAASGSTWFLVATTRGEYQVVESHRVDQTGRPHCMRSEESGTSRECLAVAVRFASTHRGYRFPDHATPARTQAKEVLRRAGGIDFDVDFRTLGTDAVALLLTWARLTKYRAPRTENGSTARYFFQHLTRIKTCD